MTYTNAFRFHYQHKRHRVTPRSYGRERERECVSQEYYFSFPPHFPMPSSCISPLCTVSFYLKLFRRPIPLLPAPSPIPPTPPPPIPLPFHTTSSSSSKYPDNKLLVKMFLKYFKIISLTSSHTQYRMMEKLF